MFRVTGGEDFDGFLDLISFICHLSESFVLRLPENLSNLLHL